MKLILVTQEIQGHKNFNKYDYKIGDILLVEKETSSSFLIKNLRNGQTTYCIPKTKTLIYFKNLYGTNSNQYLFYSEFFSPLLLTLKDLINR